VAGSAPTPRAAGARRARVRVEGRVQGVGFRPFVSRLAVEHALGGFVLNDATGVLIEVEGAPDRLERFLTRLQVDRPPLALIERVVVLESEPRGESAFAILESARDARGHAAVSPDIGTCADCLRELFDPLDRRHRYPFINCTNCGPRFTIVRASPYDRALTTMAGFSMCARCRAEYEDPADRRFHAQPNACPDCGPVLALLHGDGSPAKDGAHDPLAGAAAALRAGAIVAVKGIGGYHLACRADLEDSVAELRARKHRDEKPLATMVADLESARELVTLAPCEQELLESGARPIVLAPRAAAAPLAANIAPDTPELGVMLAYSPLHHLLLSDVGAPLVMTSGNLSEEPIVFGDEEARTRLGAIAELLLMHDRPIHARADDSVLRVVAAADAARVVPVRRSRGYVPGELALPVGAERHVLGCGAELKNTFCLAKGPRAWLGPHVGDLENYETLRAFRDGIAHFERLFAVRPEVVAHDLHPDYLSTKHALELDGVELVGVQHHHAHLAAALAEHGEQGAAVGAIFDGSGYGPDGTVWGGELLAGDLTEFRRVGMLLPVCLPGGAQAIRQPWRMACAWLARSGELDGGDVPVLPRALGERVGEQRWRQVCQLIESGLGSPLTSSMGRLFDAVAALCGLHPEVTYEGQAAIALEAACDERERGVYPIALAREASGLVIDPRATIAAILADVQRGVPVGMISARFHSAVAHATSLACARAAESQRTDTIVLSGGVFQNRRLLADVLARLHQRGLRTLTPEATPIGDGGISFGQVAVASARLGRSER